MKIQFSKNNYKDINDAVEKIELFQLQTFLSVIGSKGKLPNYSKYFFLERIYTDAKYKSKRNPILANYPRDYTKEDHQVPALLYACGYLSLIGAIVLIITTSSFSSLFLNPTMLDILIICLTITLFLLFIIPKVICVYKNKHSLTCYEIGEKVTSENADIFEMLLSLEKSKKDLEKVARIVEISNNLQERCKFDNTPSFSIDECNSVAVKCDGVHTMLNDATTYIRSDYTDCIELSDELIAKIFHSDAIDFSCVDGNVNSSLVDIAQICTKYNVNLGHNNRIEDHIDSEVDSIDVACEIDSYNS